MSLSVRLCGETDIDAFKAIRLEALRLAPGAYGSSHDDWRALPDDEWRKRGLSNPTFLVFDAAAPVGLMGLLPETSFKKRHRATLAMVYVSAAWRGAGAAQLLLDAAINHARKLRLSQLELNVMADNLPAIRFYERNGFAIYGRLANATLSNGVSQDEFMMARTI